MLNIRCYAFAAVLFGLISGCGSVMSSAGAGPIEDDPGERTFGQQMIDEGIETKAKVNINAANDSYDAAHLSIVSFNGFVLRARLLWARAATYLATSCALPHQSSASLTPMHASTAK